MKVVYFANSLSHKRVLESFLDHKQLDQTLLMPVPVITSNIVPEDFRDLKIKNIKTYKNFNEASNIISNLKPDVVVQTSTGTLVNIPKNTKKAYISHGMVGNHVIPMSPKGSAKTWKGFDLYCGATKVFKNWVDHATGIEQNVLLNAVPQFDLLNEKYINEYKYNVINATNNKSPLNTILFCGFCCKDRGDFDQHNEDFFATTIELEKIARKHNFLALIKPRQPHSKNIKFLQTHKWGSKYLQPYINAYNSKYTHFINTTTHIYRYYFADIIVCNGCSTTEIEACIMNKPLILVRTKVNSQVYDPFETVRNGAGIQVSNLNELENVILNLNYIDHINKQNALLNSMGIVADGLAYKRVQEALLTL